MKLLIVNYHYIRNKKYKRGIYPKTLEDLKSNIDLFNKNKYKFISQNEILNLKKGKYVLFTFDDGLKEQMEAFEILNKKGIPAIFYVSTYPIKEKKVLNVHKLHFIRSKIEDKELLNFVFKFVGNIKFPKNLNELYRYDNLEAKKVKYIFNFVLKEDIKTTIIDKLFLELANENKFSKELYMDENDIIKLSKYNYLGTHTHRHLPLATLKDNEIIYEIKESLKYFKDLGINKIDSISYPYGGQKAVNEKVINISKQFFKFGLTMQRGINYSLKEPLQLKRIDVNDIKEFI